MTEIADDFKERLAAEMRAKELGTRIKLRLNPNEAEHNRLVDLIGEMSSKGYDINRKYLPIEEEQVARAFNDASNAAVRHLQTILKHEWGRVKKGDVTLPLLSAFHSAGHYADFLSCCWAAIQRCSNVIGLT